jgi:thiol-disulfide isomerase/thioredoxin
VSFAKRLVPLGFFLACLQIQSPRAVAEEASLSILMEIYSYKTGPFELTRRRECSLMEDVAEPMESEAWFVRPKKNPPRPFTVEDVEAIVQWMQRQSVPGLVLDGHPELGDDALELLQPLKHLTFLSLRKTGISSHGYEALRHFKKLRYLDVSDTEVKDSPLPIGKSTLERLPADWSKAWNQKAVEEPALPTSFFFGPSPKDGIAGRLPPKKFPADYSLQLRTLEGKKVDLSKKRGHVIFLNFWATWCGPCRQELPSLEVLYQVFKDRDIFFAYVTSQPASVVGAYLRKNQIDVPVYVAESGTTGPYMQQGIPVTFIIGKDGYWAVKRLGSGKWDSQEIIDYLDSLIKGK